MRSGRLRFLVPAAAILATSLSMLAAPQSVGAASQATAGECTLSLQLSFSPNLKVTPQTSMAINASGSLSSCVQAPAIALSSFSSGSLSAQVGSCEAMSGHGFMYFSPVMQADVEGLGSTQAWVMESVNPSLQTIAVADMNWLNVAEINACRSSTGTATMTLTGVITFEDPTIS